MYIHGHYYNQNSEKISVHILTHGDRSKEVEIGAEDGDLYFTDDPVEITTQVNDTWDHLLCNQANVRLLTRNYVADFFCASCRDAVVNIYREDTCLFAGYIEPQTYSQGYNEDLDEVELTCVDALIALEYSRYRDIGGRGVSYETLKADAEQRDFMAIFREIMDGVSEELDIMGKGTVRYLYDGSKAVDNVPANRYNILSQLSINELLFLGDDEDDVWQQNEVLEEILKFLNLHITQEGLTFYVFSWETVKGSDSIGWRDMETGESVTMRRAVIDITTRNVTDTDTTISLSEVFNQITLTCDIKSMENLIESPLDDDSLISPYRRRQLYMREYSAEGNGVSAHKGFAGIIKYGNTTYDAASMTDWYMQVMDHKNWEFYSHKFTFGNIIDFFCKGGNNQQDIPNHLSTQMGAAILKLGKVELKTDHKDDSPIAKIDMSNCLCISINGNGVTKDVDNMLPREFMIKEAIPMAVYRGHESGGVFSPTDNLTKNYIVFSGSIVLNPIRKVSRPFKELWDKGYDGIAGDYYMPTVYCENNGDGRFYAQQWFKNDDNGIGRWDEEREHGFVPFCGEPEKKYEFNGTYIGDESDYTSKVPVLQCMLIIGDKCVVETKGDNRTYHFKWIPYKKIEECKDADEYYRQSFSLGFNPKIGDFLIGKEYNIANNIDFSMNINAEGTAIPIKKDDKISGAVRFMILGPVNAIWDNRTYIDDTFYRKFNINSERREFILPNCANILINKFECKLYSDNGRVSDSGDNDIIYMSDTRESFINKKDDVEFKINSALTSAERFELGVSDSIKMSTPLSSLTGIGVLDIYDHIRKEQAKAEQLYVDSYYAEYHEPRVEMTQKLEDKTDGIVALFDHYRHPFMGKTFFVEGISRNLTEGYAEMKLKEIDT